MEHKIIPDENGTPKGFREMYRGFIKKVKSSRVIGERERAMTITYVVAKVQTNCSGNKVVEQFQFADVESAIDKHIYESRGYQDGQSGYWDIFVQYEL